ncbi:tripeptidyl-peptidase 1 [Diaporthe helianthi]|uniref:tripeptidyl-peptidase II n=1 Tax=Diaporthe helianthi TaxID=158607 RepID=A0A2P5I9H4_DIAHE|nr:tripeptidyl-peptidase 1 [Diaporthe helianthi]
MGLVHTTTVLLALASTALSSRTWSSRDVQNDLVVFDSLSSPPLGWVKNETQQVDKEAAPIRLRLHLAHQNMDKFHQMASNIATPGNSQYGAHIPQRVIDEIITPRTESRNMVMDWLENAGLGGNATYSARGDSIHVLTSIAQVERLLNAEYNSYRNTETNEVVVRTLEFSLPGALVGHIDLVQPTTLFSFRAYNSNISGVRPLDSLVPRNHLQALTPDDCGGRNGTNPTCLANLYDVKPANDYTTGLLGIAGFLEQYAAPHDLEVFLTVRGVEGSNSSQSFTCVGVNGGLCPTELDKPSNESSLHVQYARGIAGSVPITHYSTGGRGEQVGNPDQVNSNEPFVEFLDYLLTEADPLPNTLSISYSEVQSTVPDSYAQHVCDLFSQLGARGVSVLVASGDSGVGAPEDCTTNAGGKQFMTTFPASCPWVTVVGGTTGVSPEGAWSSAGGGFSSLFPRPSYQDEAVQSWLDSGAADAMKPYFNATGRAYPDVAAQAETNVVTVDSIQVIMDGTGAATPTFAAIIQLVNSDRIANGKPGLGFLNPWLYANASSSSALTDINTGGITGCDGQISGAGFEAASGWDPATGLGTPVFSSLLDLSNQT